MSDELAKFVELVNAATKKEEGAESFLGTDLRIASHVPYGVLSRIP